MTRRQFRQTGCRGFSLVEVVVAFAVLALSLSVLYQIFAGAARRAALVQDYDLAVALAESVLTRIGTEEPLVAGRSSGEIQGRFRWSRTVEPITASPTRTSAQMQLQPYQVTVTVTRQTGSQRPLVTLTTVRLGAAP